MTHKSQNSAVGLVPTLYFPEHLKAAVADYGEFLPLLAAHEMPRSSEQPCLWFDGEQLQLVAPQGAMQAWVTTEEVTKRAAGVSLLARACNLLPRQSVSILDAMAGWGVDGLALQLRGAHVVQVERNPGAWALLHDLRRRFGFSTDPMAVRCADAWEVLQQPADLRRDLRGDLTGGVAVEVVYLDPMFAARKKTALPSKRLQLLAQVTAVAPSAHPSSVLPEPELEQWIAAAQQVASSRVVVKRRLKDPPMQPRPAWQLKGKTVRYDCYPGLASTRH